MAGRRVKIKDRRDKYHKPVAVGDYLWEQKTAKVYKLVKFKMLGNSPTVHVQRKYGNGRLGNVYSRPISWLHYSAEKMRYL